MPESVLLIVPVMTVVAFVLGGLYYAVLGDRLTAARTAATAGRTTTGPATTDPTAAPATAPPVKAPPWTFAAEAGRCLVLAGVVTGLAVQAGIDTWPGGLALGLVLWIGFPAVLWTGAIVHENTPWRLAVIHAGDWLVKLLVLGTIAGVWL
ncbi:DUF1761 domain-containing protein [Planobispora longispora]|uniref:DUF1761 domain-containing protein n=1 Tax=Planobispora longispora TaxID=28887 RepID=A0A8J3RHS2_9ACTN|nr:DUF1761 domain-containing protein [Planobispora longispora]BFE85256.1 hypothetical protein GCM10020093_078570 [Planobispora longispora]GIH75104.1 hypothetical protein Plo01_15330 [Planobispora longispora]